MFLAKVQKIKRGTPKGDKKRERETKEEIARLEADLKKRQQKEIVVRKCLLL